MAVSYAPPAASRAALGAINSLFGHPNTTLDRHVLHGADFICTLPSGELYFESALELDTDGSVFAAQDGTGQAGTSAKYRDSVNLDADATNYIVLPEGGFTDQVGISLGDIAVVIYQDRLAYACFGDFGPDTKLGEGSIALHRALGFERVVNGRLQNVGIDREVVTIVFPNSGVKDLTSQDHNRVGVLNVESTIRGVLLLGRLMQTGDQFESAELARVKSPRQLKIPSNRQELVKLLRPWVEDIVAGTPHPLTIEGKKPADFLLDTARGLDALQKSSSMFFQTVYVDLNTDPDTDGSWYVRRISFSLNPFIPIDGDR